MSEELVLLGLFVCAVSGVPGLLCARSTCVGQGLSTAILVAGCGLGLTGVAAYWWGANSAEILWPWPIPGGEFRVQMDGLSALFLVPVFLIAALGSIFGLSYWKQTEHPENGRKLRLFYGLLPAAMALMLLARNGLLFLVGWEIMALANFFLVTTEDQDPQVRRAGWIYLGATHFSTLSLFALFALFASASGSFHLRPLHADEISPPLATAVFVLCAAGFGLKAGVMPLHVWLPGAHAMAPSHVSAMMSGVVIKMGIYGLVRVTSFLPNPPLVWGGSLLALGAVSGVLGVAYAIGQHDLKRLLAYHSIENIGIIVMGLGLALAGRSLGRVDWIVLGLAGALLHVWNHAFFKSLLFFGAGSVIHATHTRDIDHLGGLAKQMPHTAICFLVGAVAICGLPPLNGFVSEFLVYLGLFRTLGLEAGPTFVGAAFAAPALALIGALAVACFVKVFGVVFLGTPRSRPAAEARESGLSMVGSMGVLVACCLAIGLAPGLVAPLLTQAVQAWAAELPAAEVQLTAYAPLGWISVMGLLLLAVTALTSVLLRSRCGRGTVTTGPTWGCGYVLPTARMQYTSSSFAQMLVALFAWALRPQRRQPADLPLFPGPTTFHSDVPDVVLEEGILPAIRWTAWLCGWFRVFQQGSIQAYLLYIVLTLLVLLFWW
ncbi:MAG: proton-conducting transporter membrane subunit [Planctomycetota bacterium]|nr:proton-conducting transporter membrane subunit [Planctomycetota bacterium]